MEGVIRRLMPLVHRPGPSLPQDLAFQSVFEQTIRRGGHVEADMVNATGSQARPWAQPPLHSNIQHGFRGQAEPKACGGGGEVIRWLMPAGPWAPLEGPAFKPPTRLQASQQFALD